MPWSRRRAFTRAVERLGERELAAALQFAVLALVILPLLPAGPYGPFDSIRPRALWTAVLVFSGINFAGYLAGRAIGVARGYSLTGILGGVISSTAVTLQFARRSRDEPKAAGALGLGVLGACTVLVVRVGVVATVLSPVLGARLVPRLLPILALGAAALALAFARVRVDGPKKPPREDASPLGLWAALKMVAAFQLVLLAIPYVQAVWGSAGVRSSAVLLGLTDMDALTFSMTRLGTDPDAVALGVDAILIGLLTNTIFKLVLALILGSGAFRRVVGSGLLALGAATCLVLLIAH